MKVQPVNFVNSFCSLIEIQVCLSDSSSWEELTLGNFLCKKQTTSFNIESHESVSVKFKDHGGFDSIALTVEHREMTASDKNI